MWTGRTGPFEVEVGEGVFVPSLTTHGIAEALNIEPGERVIDVGSGSGVLSFVAARLGAATVIGVERERSAVAAATRSAARLGLSDKVVFRAGNLLEAAPDVEGDVVIGDVSGIPDEIAEISGWFPAGCKAGGPTGAEVPSAMLDDILARRALRPGGRLYLPTGSIQAEERILQRAHAVFGASNCLPVYERVLPLPEVLARSQVVERMLGEGVINLKRRGSRLLWEMRVWCCHLPATEVVRDSAV
jgi:SAM-dependent methyltransferase